MVVDSYQSQNNFLCYLLLKQYQFYRSNRLRINRLQPTLLFPLQLFPVWQHAQYQCSITVKIALCAKHMVVNPDPN